MIGVGLNYQSNQAIQEGVFDNFEYWDEITFYWARVEKDFKPIGYHQVPVEGKWKGQS